MNTTVFNLILMMLLYCLLGFIVASLELCFQYISSKGQIFYFYRVFLEKLHYKHSKILEHLSKPLGLCPYCNGTWLAIIVYLYFFNINLQIFLFIGITWFFIRLIDTKILNNEKN